MNLRRLLRLPFPPPKRGQNARPPIYPEWMFSPTLQDFGSVPSPGAVPDGGSCVVKAHLEKPGEAIDETSHHELEGFSALRMQLAPYTTAKIRTASYAVGRLTVRRTAVASTGSIARALMDELEVIIANGRVIVLCPPDAADKGLRTELFAEIPAKMPIEIVASYAAIEVLDAQAPVTILNSHGRVGVFSSTDSVNVVCTEGSLVLAPMAGDVSASANGSVHYWMRNSHVTAQLKCSFGDEVVVVGAASELSSVGVCLTRSGRLTWTATGPEPRKRVEQGGRVCFAPSSGVARVQVNALDSDVLCYEWENAKMKI